MSVQLQIRADIEYLASSWKTPNVYPINGDISKDKAFAKLPVLLSYIKPEESKQAPQGNGKIQKWRIELFLAYVKLPDGCDPTTKSHEYDEQVSEMSELLDKLHTGLTKQYINGVKNPIANARGYIADQPLTFLETYFEFGSNKYMAVRATWSMTVNVANCFDCTDFVSGTFDPANVPPNDSNPIGGSNGQKGDILYWSDILEKWVRLNIGADGQVLKAVDGLPEWDDETGGGITEETDPIFEAWETANGANLINHLSDTNNPHQVTKAQVGLSNVDNTSDADKPVSNATQTALNLKQDSIGYTPENVANKTDTMAGNTTSSTKYLSAKGVYDWVISLGYITASALSGYATQAWVNSQGFITNVITALGYTPANKAGETFTGTISATNLSGTNTGDNATNSQYSGLATSKEDTANKSTSTGDIASSVKFPVWSAVVSYVTGLGYLLASTAASTYQVILTSTNFGSFINGLTAKATPVDADGFPYMDTADGNKAKFLSWANLKTTLASTFALVGDNGIVGITTDQSVAVTGNTTITKVASIPVAGGVFKYGDGFSYQTFCQKSAQTSNDTWQIYVYINTSDDLTGAINICILSSISNTTRWGAIKRASNYLSGGNIYGHPITTTSNSDLLSSTAVLTNYGALNPANNWYFIVALRHNGSSQADTLSHIKTVLYKEKS